MNGISLSWEGKRGNLVVLYFKNWGKYRNSVCLCVWIRWERLEQLNCREREGESEESLVMFVCLFFSFWEVGVGHCQLCKGFLLSEIIVRTTVRSECVCQSIKMPFGFQGNDLRCPLRRVDPCPKDRTVGLISWVKWPVWAWSVSRGLERKTKTFSKLPCFLSESPEVKKFSNKVKKKKVCFGHTFVNNF